MDLSEHRRGRSVVNIQQATFKLCPLEEKGSPSFFFHSSLKAYRTHMLFLAMVCFTCARLQASEGALRVTAALRDRALRAAH